MVLTVKSFLGYYYDVKEKRIKKRAKESGDDLYRNALQLLNGIPNSMSHVVNQLVERFIKSNGDTSEDFKFYYSG
jgi:uncharacterized protein (DUF1800 family)